jgi:hypothetical protein
VSALRACTVSVVLALSCPWALADKPTVFVPGDCGLWVKTQSPALRATMSGWLLGYLSGLSMRHEQPNDPLASLNSPEQATLWLDKYCRNNPLSNLQVGGNSLFGELDRQMSQSR